MRWAQAVVAAATDLLVGGAALCVERLLAVGEELADVVSYSLALANALDIDIARSVQAKMIKNAVKYPAEEFRGRYGTTDET